jgi:putative nucleotidyltransferase with HDIG domain
LSLLAAGTLLDREAVEKLTAHNVDYIDIVPERETAPDEEIPNASQERDTPQSAFESAIDGIKQLFESVREEGKLNDEEVSRSFNPLVKHFQQEKDVVSLLLSLGSKDDYTYHHSVQVGMLSYYIAKWLGFGEQTALSLGKAGFLHDIGKSRIPDHILQKPGRLTDEEFAEIKKHTTYGHEILRASPVEDEIALIALQHHERLDGRGYPHGIPGEQIHPMAKVVSIADVYSAMICNRVYQKKRDLLNVLRELYRMSFGELDPAAVHAFITHMIPNFIGKKITLADGRHGIIIMTNPSDYFRPLVRIDDVFYDLSHERTLEIVSIHM